MKQYILIFLLTVSPLLSETKFISYNVWFDDTSGVSYRYQKIIDFISIQDADYICLQEVTPIFLTLLEKKLSKKYHIYSNEAMKKSYGLVILSKTDADVEMLKLHTRMGRDALVLQDEHHTLVNVHLESMMDDTFIRGEQLLQIQEHTKHNTNLIICGDFNFGDRERENKLLEGFIDTGKGTKEPSFDISENRLARSTRFYNEPSRRLDRIFIPLSYNTRFTYKLIKLNLSDHYPLLVTIK